MNLFNKKPLIHTISYFLSNIIINVYSNPEKCNECAGRLDNTVFGLTSKKICIRKI